MSTISEQEYRQRIAVLEKLNATLAAEVDRMRNETLTEDYYTLAEVRLAADFSIVEYGSCEARLQGIANLIDKKRPELNPNGPQRTPATQTTGK